MASPQQQDHHHLTTTTAAVYAEDLDEDDDTEDEDLTLRNNQNVEEDDVDLVDDDDEEEEDDSMSSGVGEVTIAVAGLPTATTTTTETLAVTPTAPLTSNTTTTTTAVDVVTPLPRSDVVFTEQKKIMPLDESRRLFQRLWTDEDEIELLQGFLDYTNQLVVNNSFHNHHNHHHHHHDTTAFYDQIKNKLQLDFNKNQLVEKLRRLKKKYRNVLSKISSGKDYVFKTPHDQITFDISCKIWSSEAAILSTPVSVASVDVNSRFDDEEPSNPYPNLNLTFNLNDQNGNGNSNSYPNNNTSEKKTPRSRKRSRSSGIKIEEKINQQQQPNPSVGVGGSNPSNSLNQIPNLIEETVKSCLLPLFKELLDNSQNGFRGNSSRGLMNLDPFGGSMNLPFGDIKDEKWRKQHILELEVCSKRLELVQDQIKSQLEELKSMRR